MSICLHGGYYYDNFGDVLLFKLYEEWVRLKTTEPIVYPKVPLLNRERFQEHFPGALMGTSGKGLWKAMLFAGGGHFAQPQIPQWRRKWSAHFLKQHFFLVEQCIRSKIPYAVLGVGAGPIYGRLMCRAARRIFEHARVISVRDPESFDFVSKDLGVQRPIKIIPDAAVSLSSSDIPEVLIRRVRRWGEDALDKKWLGIHLTDSFLRNTPQATLVCKVLLEKLAECPDVCPVVFTDYSRRRKEGRDWLSTLIEEKTGRRCLSWAFAGVDDLLALISKLSSVITPKLHVGIAAYAFGKYVESFATDEKIPRFYHLAGRSGQCDMLENVDKKKAEEKILQAIQAARQEVSVADERWGKLREQADEHKETVFAFLDTLNLLSKTSPVESEVKL